MLLLCSSKPARDEGEDGTFNAAFEDYLGGRLCKNYQTKGFKAYKRQELLLRQPWWLAIVFTYGLCPNDSKSISRFSHLPDSGCPPSML